MALQRGKTAGRVDAFQFNDVAEVRFDQRDAIDAS
jgi:hypothetical protein